VTATPAAARGAEWFSPSLRLGGRQTRSLGAGRHCPERPTQRGLRVTVPNVRLAGSARCRGGRGKRLTGELAPRELRAEAVERRRRATA